MTASQPQPTSGRPPVDLVVDGHRATLVELTTTHALVHTQNPVKPEQVVRVVLRAPDGTVLRVKAQVASAKFEMPKEGSRYRVELRFEGETAGIEQFVANYA